MWEIYAQGGSGWMGYKKRFSKVKWSPQTPRRVPAPFPQYSTLYPDEGTGMWRYVIILAALFIPVAVWMYTAGVRDAKTQAAADAAEMLPMESDVPR